MKIGVALRTFASIGVISSIGMSASAMAQDASTQSTSPANDAAAPIGAPSIVVTAQKREERLLDVPISISAISGDELAASGVTQFHDLSQIVPGFTSEQYGDARVGRMTLRGVASQQDNPGKQSSLGVFLDGVFLARYGAATSELADIERVEVLRGPQGTLFGANTASGLINIITRRPSLDETTGFVEAVLGNHAQRELRASISTPIVQDALGFSLSAYNVHRGGLTDNVTTGRSVDNLRRLGGRARLYYEGDGIDVTLTADYNRERSECCSAIPVVTLPGANVFGIPIEPLVPAGAPFSHETIQNTENTNHNQGGGLSAEINVEIGSHTLTSVTAWRRWDVDPISDIDSLPLSLLDNFIIDQRHDQFSQELRLTSPSTGMINYVFGLYYFDRQSSDLEILQPGSDIAFLIMPGQVGDTTISSVLDDASYAAFGHVDFHVTDRLTLSAGGRYTREEQDVDFTQTSTNFAFASLGNVQRSRDESHFTWVVNASYELDNDLTAYASIARGSKPGGFDLTRLPNFNNFEFEDETNTNYEIGLKGELFDNRLRFSSALFLTNYSNFQAVGFDGLNLITSNADLFRTKGGEIEITAIPTPGLTLQFQGSYVEARYVRFPNGTCPPGVPLPCDLSGNRLSHAPEVTLGASAEYRTSLNDSLEGFVRVDGNYKSDIFFQQNLDPSAYQGPRTVFNARLGFETESGFLLEAFARNLFNQEYVNFIYPSPLATGFYVGYPADRRQIGLRGRFSF